MDDLLRLVHDAGHRDFRDARGPMGFTQRQAAGRFTRDEAAAFIDRLQEAEGDESGPAVPTPTTRVSTADQAVRRLPVETLVAELERRGWTVTKP